MLFRQRRVNAKVRALREHRDENVRWNAARVLGRFGDPRAIGPLASALNDSETGVREQAVKALARLGPAGVPPLVGALQGNRPEVSRAAAQCLGELEWQPENEIQRAQLAVAGQDWDRAAAIGADAVEPLIVALVQLSKVWPIRDGFHQMQLRDQKAQAADALWRIGAAAAGPLVAVLNDPDCRVRAEAAKALGQLYDSTAAAAPGKPADPRVTEALISRLNDTVSFVRGAAAQALGELGDQQATGPLVAALNDFQYEVTVAAAQALGRLHDPHTAVPHTKPAGPSVTGPLITVLTGLDAYSRKAAADTLQKIGDARTVGPMIAAARTISADRRWSWNSDPATPLAAALTEIVERSLPDISERTLHKLAEIDDIRWSWESHEDNVCGAQGQPASLADVRRLAREELALRTKRRLA